MQSYSHLHNETISIEYQMEIVDITINKDPSFRSVIFCSLTYPFLFHRHRHFDYYNYKSFSSLIPGLQMLNIVFSSILSKGFGIFGISSILAIGFGISAEMFFFSSFPKTSQNIRASPFTSQCQATNSKLSDVLIHFPPLLQLLFLFNI